MRKLVAEWNYNAVARQGIAAASPLLNLGSSTGEFREVKKPQLNQIMFGPLARDGFEVVHADMKNADGVDLVGDIFDPAYAAALRARGFRSVLASSILEHVEDPAAFVRACEDIVGPGGFVFMTVPHKYPYHADPIDTMFRPDVEELTALFTRSDLIEGRLVTEKGMWADVLAGGPRAMAMLPVKAAWRLARFRIAPGVARTEAARLKWFWRPYVITCAVYQVRGSA
ncbi:hypothetical protein [Polymorphobacter sp.]|uniref:hypothetical protein n=1 Tax=Polymorphobacter sp. TaxID=1909290 RepID=UPI003F709343